MLLTNAIFDTSFIITSFVSLNFTHTFSWLPPTTIINTWSTFYCRAIYIVVALICAESTVVIRFGIISPIFIFFIILPWAIPVITIILEKYWKNKYIAEVKTVKCLIQNVLFIKSSIEKFNKLFYLDKELCCIYQESFVVIRVVRNQKIHQPYSCHLRPVGQDCHILLFSLELLLHKPQGNPPIRSMLPILR